VIEEVAHNPTLILRDKTLKRGSVTESVATIFGGRDSVRIRVAECSEVFDKLGGQPSYRVCVPLTRGPQVEDWLHTSNWGFSEIAMRDVRR
jgi:hypothetical protein